MLCNTLNVTLDNISNKQVFVFVFCLFVFLHRGTMAIEWKDNYSFKVSINPVATDCCQFSPRKLNIEESA